MRIAFIVALSTVLALAVAGCSSTQQAASKAGAEAKNAVSPLVGSWQINGDTPPPQANLPQFVRLDFKADGTLEASYVAAGGALAKVINTPSKLKDEHDTYALHGDRQVSIIEGSRALEYAYTVRAGKLFLTPSGDTAAIVYQKD